MAKGPGTTRIANDTTVKVPQSTDAGDAPADTLDPLERVSSTDPDTGAAAAAGHLTCNAVLPVASIVPPTLPNKYEVVTGYANDGTTAVSVVRNYGSGTSAPSITRPTTGAVAKGAFYAVSGGAFEATVGGTTGATAPTWPPTVGNTVVDGSVTWKRVA